GGAGFPTHVKLNIDLNGGTILANYFNEKKIEDLVVVSPDLGSVTRSRKFANTLNGEVPIAIIALILGVLQNRLLDKRLSRNLSKNKEEIK
ncbi:MAG: DUF969 domain-containing protein, partial [Clostridium perfringens]|nr:DUF969 domain-containing protein [Clostridium perfringens]